MKTKIIRIGDSKGVILPKILLTRTGLGLGRLLDIELQNGDIMLKPRPERIDYQSVVSRFTEGIRDIPGVHAVVLYGSVARGETSQELDDPSDVDFFVVVEDHVIYGRISELALEVEKENDFVPISVIDFTLEEFEKLRDMDPFIAEVLATGKVLYGSGAVEL